MGDRCGMSISADSPLDETLNLGPLALLLRRQYEFPFGINTVQFSIFFSMYFRGELSTGSYAVQSILLHVCYGSKKQLQRSVTL